MNNAVPRAEGARMAIIWPIAAGTGVIAVAVAIILATNCSMRSHTLSCNNMVPLWDFYDAKLRASFFTGFLSLGGFLLSLQTFIIVNMKKDVFDSVSYTEHWNEVKYLARAGNKYDPLRDLSSVLFFSILSCITCAILQVTIGLIRSPITVVLCIWCSLIAIIFLIECLFLIRKNLSAMFKYLGESNTRTE